MSLDYSGLERRVVDDVPLPLEHVPDEETEAYDAELTENVTTELSAFGVLYLRRGTPVEIKTCRRWIEDGGSRGGRRRGRWWVGRRAHRELVDLGGVYLLALLDGDDELADFCLAAVDELDDLLGTRWVENGAGGGVRKSSAQLPWPYVLEGSA